MRLPRFVLAGILLFAAIFTLAALLLADGVGAIAGVVFLPLWYAISAVNAGVGVFAAGYRAREEAVVGVAVFGIPAVVAGFVWWASSAWWDGGPVVHSGRTLVVLAAGLFLWAAILVLSGLLTAKATAVAAAVFLPLWFLVCVGNLLVGVLAAGYGVGEEIPILVLNFAVPAAVAVIANWRMWTETN
jgi:hypothetical protein